MTSRPIRFPFKPVHNAPAVLMPRLSLILHNGDYSVEVTGLLDTGSAVNVLPHHVGLELGAVWKKQTQTVPLVGSLGRFEARGLLVLASHPQLTPKAPVQLGFAWTQTEDAPVIFGHMNFFTEFNVCFYRSQGFFEIHPKTDE
jgi:hypothetical protein